MKPQLLDHDVMYIDANIFLEVLLKHKKHEQCSQILDNIAKLKLRALISSVNLDSIIFIISRYGTAKTQTTFVESLQYYEGLRIYYPRVVDRTNSLEYLNKGLDYEDSLTLHSALINKCTHILSYDRDFDKQSLIPRIEPENLLSKH